MHNYSYKVILEPQAEGGYTAFVPKLPGCVSEGETYEETLANIREALELYLEVLEERCQAILPDDIMVAEVGVCV